MTRLITDHLGTPVASVLSNGSGVDWVGGFTPWGEDWQRGTSQESLSKGIFLRLPGQWKDPSWSTASYPFELFYNLHRWYDPSTGRYISVDPLPRRPRVGRVGTEHLFGAVRPGLADTLFFDRFSTYGYAASNPIFWVDPLGLSVCEGVPLTMPECKAPGSGCCVLACITELRAGLCKWKQMEPWIDLAGGLRAGIEGAGFGGGVKGVCIGVTAVGGGTHLAQDWAEDIVAGQFFFIMFKKCVNVDCGVSCENRRPCSIERQFALTASEVFN